MINKIVSYIMVICLFCAVPQVVFADETVITSPHAVLMEASTGKIIYEKEKDVQVSPASITKIMTLLLIFDEIANQNLDFEDEVTPVLMQNLWEVLRFILKKEKNRV